MNDQSDHQQPGPPGPEDVGSVGEEAMKLFGAFADLARQHTGDAAGGVGGLAGQVAAMAHDVGEHIATDSVECKYCPVCRVVHAVRQTSPDVKAHLMVAASSLLQAAAGLMETPPPDSGSGTPRGPAVERIDLDDAPPDERGDQDPEPTP